MKILSIETSCDDTGITIFEAKGSATRATFKILANNINSQKIHAEYGGVFPMLAKREHIKSLPILLEKSMREAKNPKLDAIAVTYGPGLPPSLWTGIVFAKELAAKWNIPLIPVNHMEGHILSVFAKHKGKFTVNLTKAKFPMLSLLVSGGHTELVLIKDLGKYEIIGKTMDDAAGEAFDKVARMLDLPYPGGPKISKLAEEARIDFKKSLDSFEIVLPRPMLHSKNLDFSFSGLKTAVLYLIKKIGPLDDETKKHIAMEFENAVVETLIYKTEKALNKHKAKMIIVAGGVAANKFLQKEMREAFGKKKILLPERELTGDNSLMIGVAGYLQYMKNKKKVPSVDSIKAEGNLQL